MARDLYPGLGTAVAERTFLRKDHQGKFETWDDVANRVAFGNTTLCLNADERICEYNLLKRLIADGRMLTSGRHLQHGDVAQKDRSQDVFSNCSTSITTFGLVYLLLNGSGVGRCYDDDLMLVDWDNAPNVLCVLDDKHPDFDYTIHETLRDAKHKYDGNSNVIWHTVGDSREGWANAAEYLEILAFQKVNRDKLLVLDFSQVRAANSKISGMQGRPSSGPVPLMNAFARINSIKGAAMPRWKQAMYIDHYFAEVVLMGGVRRSSRIAVKSWKDPSIFEYIQAKRPIEFLGKTPEEIVEMRKADPRKYRSFLWTANNSIGVDAEFWNLIRAKRNSKTSKSELYRHAIRVFKLATECAYYDGTGEPGFVNQDKLVCNSANLDTIKGDYFQSSHYTLLDDTSMYLDRLLKVAKIKQYTMIPNPCGEISLSIFGGLCVISDMVPYFCDTLDECEELARATTRFLIRINKMQSVYGKEVKRTNRIGVSITGVHEFAQKFWGFNFHDLIDEQKSLAFWQFLSRLKRAVKDEAARYSKLHGLPVPHTDTCIKPSGSVSKLFGLTEGWHLPAMGWYLRWVQFKNTDPLIEDYKARGYPVVPLVTYKGSTRVGFPSVLELARIQPKDRLVTAVQATPIQQYIWLMLGEKYWIRGVDETGKPLSTDTGNQISYTLKYDPQVVSYNEFCDTLREYQSQVRCCSVMPTTDGSSYEYLPEEAISADDYLELERRISQTKEDIGREHLECSGANCPTDFKTEV